MVVPIGGERRYSAENNEAPKPGLQVISLARATKAPALHFCFSFPLFP